MEQKISTDALTRRGFSIKEIAEMLGLSQSFVRLEISRGRLRALHIARRVIITPDALDTWLRGSNEQEA